MMTDLGYNEGVSGSMLDFRTRLGTEMSVNSGARYKKKDIFASNRG
jgi:hypothetical protein